MVDLALSTVSSMDYLGHTMAEKLRWNHALPWFMHDHGSPSFFLASSQMQELDETMHNHGVR